MNWFKAERPVQIMYAQVPTFHACRCQGSGIKTMTKERKEATGISGYVGSSMVEPQGRRRTEGGSGGSAKDGGGGAI